MEIGLSNLLAFKVKVYVDFWPTNYLYRNFVKLSLHLLPVSCNLTSQLFRFVYSQQAVT